MLQAPGGPRSVPSDLAGRRQLALERIDALIALYEGRATRAWRNYYVLQGLTIGLAALTPCLISLANLNPRNTLLEWLQLFFPAIAAIAAGLNHVFRWREDGVRYTGLAESIRSHLWRYQTRTGELGIALSDEQALDKLVTQVDDLNLQSLTRWSALQLAESPTSERPKPATAEP
jgi:Protein of unknown function (DUF4231)